jgi:hypothetical protein
MKKWWADEYNSLVNLDSFCCISIDADHEMTVFKVYVDSNSDPAIRKVLAIFGTEQDAINYINSIHEFLIEE